MSKSDDSQSLLPANAHAQYHSVLGVRRRRLVHAYLLLLLLGFVGGHKWYLHGRRRALPYCWLTAIPVTWVPFLLLYEQCSLTKNGLPSVLVQTMGLFGLLWELVAITCCIFLPILLIRDAFKLPAETAQCNLAIQKELALLQVKSDINP
jgi:hypothetical protein